MTHYHPFPNFHGSRTKATAAPIVTTPTPFIKMDTTVIPKYQAEPIDICLIANFSKDPLLGFFVCVYFVLGVVYICFGYRCFKSSMFATGFTFAGILVFAISSSESLLPQYGKLVISVCAGFLFGLITMLIQYVGIFMSGLHNGVLKGISGLTVYASAFVTEHPKAYWMSLSVVSVSGFTFACLNVYWKKGLTIVSTSVYGASLIAMSVDYYLERWAMVRWVYERAKLEPVVALPCPMSWFTLVLWPAAAILGIIVQYCITGTGIHHDEGLAAIKRRSKAPLRLTREQRAEQRQRKYRYLYQVRTAHGDVISQSYVQALQQKSSNGDPWSSAGGGGECSTLQSDSTHLTVLATDAPHPDSDEDIHQIRVSH